MDESGSTNSSGRVGSISSTVILQLEDEQRRRSVIDLEEFRDVNGLVPVAVGSENYAPPPSLLTSQRHDSIGSSSMRHSLTSSSSGTQLESILEADARETPPSAVSHALKALNQAAISNLQTRTLNTSSRRQLLGSTRSLVSISEKVTEEEAEADVPQKMTVHTTSAAKLVAHSNFTSSTRSGLLNNSSSRTGLTGSSSFVSGTGLARSAFMSSREALNTMGSNFQLNNIVPEEEEEDEEAPRGEGRIPETKLKGLYGSKSASNIKSVSSLSRGHGLISGMSGVIAERHSPLREYVRQDLEVGDEEDEDTDLIHSGFRDNPSHSSTTFNLLNMDGTHAASKPQSSRKSITVSIPEYDESDSSSSSKLHADKESTFQSEGEPTVYSQSGSQDTLRIYENDIMSKSLQSLSSKDQMMVVFRDLCMTVTTGTKRVFKKRATVGVERQILKNVNGVFLPGRLTAIMGASGAGKTSLLYAVAQKDQVNQLKGSVTVNGIDMHYGDVGKISGFVFQDDIIWPTMTVKEAISMAAKLRRPDLSEIEQVSTVDDIIAGLNLKNAENTIIGDAQIKGVSGGERKRCSMAMEMITNPPILFLDEPTSGLDSFTALSVIKTLKALAETGRTIVITIHQPSSEVFRLFDDLILMADGRILYQGVAERSVQYFSNLGYACPLRSNPSDFFFMSILNTDEAIESADGIEPRERIERLLNTWPEQVEYEALLKVMDSRRYNRNILLTSERHLSSIWVQFIFLYARSTKNAVRNPLVLRSKLAQTLFTSFLIGFLYYQTNLKTDTSAIQNRLGVIFFLSNGNYMSSQTSNLSVFGREKSNFKREYDLGYYSVGPYFLAKILSELPLYVLFPGLETLLIYYLAGLQTSGAKVVVAICASCLLSLLGMAVGVTIAVSTSSLQMALLVVPMLTIPLMLFSGMFLNLNSIVPALSWFQWLSPIRYCFEALVKNEFDGLNLDLAIEISGTAYKKTVQGSSIITQEGFGLDGLSVGQLLAILACSCVVFFLVSYVLLVRLVTKRSIFKSQ